MWLVLKRHRGIPATAQPASMMRFDTRDKAELHLNDLKKEFPSREFAVAEMDPEKRVPAADLWPE